MTETTDNTVPLAAARAAKDGRCPICRRPTAAETRPFCSRRCKDVDLSRWLGEVYRVPDADPAPDGDVSGETAGRPAPADDGE